MGYYHIKNIKIDRKNNNISADLADSNIYPKTYYHIDSLNDKGSFKEITIMMMLMILESLQLMKNTKM